VRFERWGHLKAERQDQDKSYQKILPLVNE
jgi:hypothetical protein